MPDIPPQAIAAAAIVLADDNHGGRPGIQDVQLAAEVLEAAVPILAEAVAAKILAHMELHGPKAGQRWENWRRYFRVAAQVASLAFTTADDQKRMAAQALAAGNYMACDPPEVPDA